MLLLREAQSFDGGDPVLFRSLPSPRKGILGFVKTLCTAFFFLSLPEIQGALLLREPVITPAISITLF